MAATNSNKTSNQEGQPILIAGGGIGGLAAAYALACKGFPVRVLEQASEFKKKRRMLMS